MEWNNGYVSDIGYPAGFFPEQAPAHLNFACLVNGYAAPVLDAGFTYCELGSGPGLTASALAAANPQGRFYACDFNPAHIAEGRELAEAAGLDNLVLLENSFDELAAGAVDLPQLDYITMYGVYSWVNDENRGHIVAFLQRYLKPGGVLYINYNAMPGWAAVHPLQKLILDVVDGCIGTRAERCDQARQIVDQLGALQTGYFRDNDSVEMRHRLQSLHTDDNSYLAHEYMNDGWRPQYHADVARTMLAIGCDYVGSANPFQAFPELYLTPEQRALLAQTAPALRETVIDFLINTSFREDIYIRGARRLQAGPGPDADANQRVGLALTVPRALVRHSINLVNGAAFDHVDLMHVVADALAQGPCTLAALAALPALQAHDSAVLYHVAALLISTGQASASTVRPAADGATARSFNRAIANAPHWPGTNRVLASAAVGNGIATSPVAHCVYRVLGERALADHGPDALVTRVQTLLRKEGYEGDNQALTDRIHRILEKLVPLWRQLGML